jgi:hypothetical protein
MVTSCCLCSLCTKSYAFFSSFFINNNCLFSIFSYLFNSDPGYNSNISSPGIEVGVEILEFTLNSSSRLIERTILKHTEDQYPFATVYDQ